jgi:hypothetical protein
LLLRKRQEEERVRMLLMSRMRMIWMDAGDVFVAFVVVVVGEEVVAVIVIVVGRMVVGGVSFAIEGCGEMLCLVVLRGEACLVVERVVGRRDLGCGVREARFVGIVVGIVVGRILSSCDGWILLWAFVVFVVRTLELWFDFVGLVGLLKEQKRL